jgi:sulfoxide reductase heme-binding subunit YedZ
VSLARAEQRRYRYYYKPLIFIACLVPALGCLGGILASSGLRVPGFNLGVDPVRFVLDNLGKTALNLLLITLLITPLRQLTGNANLMRVRRMLGLFVFTYALLHFIVYVGVFQALSAHAIIEDIVKRPFITMGFTALLMLLPLAITSTNKMMRRLGRRWQTLHRLIYVIPMLATLHFWKMLKSGYREPLLYASMFALLLGWRLWRRYGRTLQAAPTSRCALPRVQEKA